MYTYIHTLRRAAGSRLLAVSSAAAALWDAEAGTCLRPAATATATTIYYYYILLLYTTTTTTTTTTTNDNTNNNDNDNSNDNGDNDKLTQYYSK